MVDGTIAQGQTGNGTLPIEFCTSARRKLSACEPSLKPDAWKRSRKPHQTFSTEEQNFPQTIPGLRARWISEPCCSCGQHQQRTDSAVPSPVQAVELFAITVQGSFQTSKLPSKPFESLKTTKLSTNVRESFETVKPSANIFQSDKTVKLSTTIHKTFIIRSQFSLCIPFSSCFCTLSAFT